jgi:hypothetical protein
MLRTNFFEREPNPVLLYGDRLSTMILIFAGVIDTALYGPPAWNMSWDQASKAENC